MIRINFVQFMKEFLKTFEKQTKSSYIGKLFVHNIVLINKSI